ncbi:MAG: exo-alpha-sialidase, partial [Caldilineaceae bacterium]|nr:exo-alpha-sialidase [Caldilineaceae bacterium]
MQHGILYKRPGRYSLGPVPQLLPDGRLTVGVVSSPFADHYGLADWIVLVSDDQGETFTETNDQTIPLAWPAALPREYYDRYADVQPDGSYLAAGTVGFESWPKERAAEAEELGLTARPHPNNTGNDLLIGMPKLFVMRSHDQGKTWDRRDWLVPGFSWMTAFPRWTRLQAGNILLPVYARDQEGDRGQVFVWRSDPEGDNWRLIPLSSSVSSVTGDETCFIEAEPGKVLAHIRHSTPGHLTSGYLLESWSEDAGLTWSQPLRTEVKGYPPHLLRLQDGRILCGVT